MPSDLRMVAVARTFVEAICQSANVDVRVTRAILVALGEAINTTRHAHRDRPNAQLHLQCSLGAGVCEIQLRDEGEPFDISQVPHFAPGEMRIGGRGVYPMRTLMDELSCQPAGRSG